MFCCVLENKQNPRKKLSIELKNPGPTGKNGEEEEQGGGREKLPERCSGSNLLLLPARTSILVMGARFGRGKLGKVNFAGQSPKFFRPKKT